MAIKKLEGKLGALMSRDKQLHRPVVKAEVSPAFELLNITASRLASLINDWKEAMLASSRYARALPWEPAVVTGNLMEYPCDKIRLDRTCI